MATVSQGAPRRSVGDATGISVSVADLDPVIAALGQLVGVLSPGAPGQLDLNTAWFEHPLQSTTVGVQQRPEQLVALLSELLGEVGGNGAGIPVSDPALLGTWYPLSTPGTNATNGLYAVAYPQPGGAQVFGLGALYDKSVTLGAPKVGEPSGVDVKVWGMLPLVLVGAGTFNPVLGTAGYPLSLGFAVESSAGQGPLIDVAGFSFDGVKATASFDVASSPVVTLSTVILQLQLPGESAPQDRNLTQLANIGGNELLTTAASLAVSALGRVLGADARLQFLLPLFGLNPQVPGAATQLPLLDWLEIFTLATATPATVSVGKPFIDWFTALVSAPKVLSTWLGAMAQLFGITTPVIFGAGSREDPYRVPILQSGSAGTLYFTLASTVDQGGLRKLFPGLELAAKPVSVGGSTVLQLEGALELAEFDLLPGGAVSYPGPSSLNGSANLALVNSDATQPLFSGSVSGLTYTFGAFRAGVSLSGALQVIPYCELTGVQTPNGKYDVLDLTQPGQLLKTALDELVGDLTQQLQALLPAGPFGGQLSVLIGLTAPPNLPADAQWPAPPLSASQLLATLQDPLRAIGGYYAQLLQQGAINGQAPFYYLVSQLGALLQQTGSGVTVSGSGTAANPWHAALAGTHLPVALVVYQQPVPETSDRIRLTFGLELTPPLTLPGGPQLALDVSLSAISFELGTAPLSTGNPMLLPSVGMALQLPAGFATPSIFGAKVQVRSASLSVGWNRWDGFGWSMQAGQPSLIVGDTQMPVGQDLDFDNTTSLQSLVTQQAQTFAPILVGLLGIAVCRTGSPAGTAFTGLLGLLPNLQPFLPAGMPWPKMPTLQLQDFSDPVGALKTQAAGLFSSAANAEAAMTLLAWALQGGGAVPKLAGTGTYEDPLQVPLGFTSSIGLRVWFDAMAQSVGFGLGRNHEVALPANIAMDASVRLDMIELALGAQPLGHTHSVPSLGIAGNFTLPTVGVAGGATLSAFTLGVGFGFTSATFTVTPVFALTASSGGEAPTQLALSDYLSGTTQLQQTFVTYLNAAVQAVVTSAAELAAPAQLQTFNNVYTLLADLGLALPRATLSAPYGVDPAGWRGLLADPLSYLARRAATVLETEPALLFGLLEQLLGITLPTIPRALLEVGAAMGYVAPAEQAYAPMPQALVQLARHPVQTLTQRFQQLVTNPVALAALVSRLAQDVRAQALGPFWVSITGGRYVQVTTTAPTPPSTPIEIGKLVQLSAQLQFDLQMAAVAASARFSFPAVGVSTVAQVQYSVAGSNPTPLTVSLAWGDGVLPAAAPLQIFPFKSQDFINSLAGLAPAQALSTFVTQVVDAQLLARYPLAQVAFSALGLAFQDSGGAWHLKSLLGLFDHPSDWLLSDSVFGNNGSLNLAQLSQVLKAIPSVSTSNGISVSQQAGGILVSGLPYNVQLTVAVDVTANVFTVGTALTSPLALTLGGGRVDALSLSIRLGTNCQPGFCGDVSISGDVGLPQRVFGSFGYDGGAFSLAVGEQGQGNPVLQLLPFDGWVALVPQVARLAIQALLQELTSTLLTALQSAGADAFVARLRKSAGLLDVNGLITSLTDITSPTPAAIEQAALQWLLARVSAQNVANTTQAITCLFTGLVSGMTATNGLIQYQPDSSLPLTILAGSTGSGGTQQLGLWFKLDLPQLSLLQLSVDTTGVGIALANPSQPIFTFGVHASMPIAGQTGPALDFVYSASQQSFTLSFDPQGADASGNPSPLARMLYPSLFQAQGGPTAANVEAWLLQILVQVLPRYLSIVIFNTATVKGWLDAPLAGTGPTPGSVLTYPPDEPTQSLLTVSAGGVYELNSFANLLQLSPATFLGNFVIGLLSKPFRALALGSNATDGIWLEPNPSVPNSYGVRVTVTGLAVGKYLALQLGPSGPADVAWITGGGGTAPSNPGISVYVPVDPTSHVPAFGSLELNFVNVGLDVTGANHNPLVSLARFQLGGVSPRVLLSLQFANGVPSASFGAAITLDQIALTLAPTTLTGNANPVVQNLLGSGAAGSTPTDGAPTNPAFSATVGWVRQLYVNLYKPDGSSGGAQVLIPVQRSFGPLHVNDIGFGVDNTTAGNPVLDLQFDGGVQLAGLAVDVQGLVVGVPVAHPTDFNGYSLDLAGLDVSYSGGNITIAGGLLKQDSPLRYDGAALIQIGSAFSIAALGSYAMIAVAPPSTTTVPSLFVFAVLDAALGGPPAFFVTGFAGGFSYNRGLTLPGPAEVQTYPLVQAAMQPANFFGTPSAPQPEDALAKLSQIVFPSVGEYWIAAGLKFTSYKLISSFALVEVQFGRTFQLGLIGASVMTMPPMVSESDALAYIEMGLVVSIEPDAGKVSVQAQLTPNSFVLSRAAHLTGGFAFVLWWSNDNPDGASAGDFVVTFGGYHPAFKAPAYYPVVPRLGLNWAISSSPDISISGDAYFALTPSAVMAGTHLSLVFDAGPLRAWLQAAADFILSWKPFWFDVSISVSVGVTFQTTIAGVSLTLSASLGCSLEIYGPPVGGSVGVDWYVISFSIPFGASKGAGDAPYATFDLFAQAMLPTPSDAPNTASASRALGALEDVVAGDAPQQVLKLTAAAGLLSNDSTLGWLIRPFGFTLRVDTAIPATTTVVAGTGAVLPAGPNIGIRPMNVSSVATGLEMYIESLPATTPPTKVNIPASTVTVQQLLGGAPEGLWAQTPLDPDAAPTADMVQGVVMGVTVTGDQIAPINPIPALNLPGIDLAALAYDTISPIPLPYGAVPYPAAAALEQGDNFALLMATVMNATAVSPTTGQTVVAERALILQALRDCQVEALSSPDLSVLASAANALYVAPPILAQLGWDLAPVPTTGRTVTTAAAARTAALPPPLRQARLMGGALRYRLTGGRPSADGLRLPWTCRASARWVDVQDGPSAASALALFAATGTSAGTQRAQVFSGSTSVWEVDPFGTTTLQASGPLALEVAAFNRVHELIAYVQVGSGGTVTLPPGTAQVAFTGVETAAPGAGARVVGWQTDSQVLRLNSYYLMGEGFVLRPQWSPRLRQRGGARARGLLDCSQVLAQNRLSGANGARPTGWVETLVPAGLESVAVLVGPGADAPSVAVTGRTLTEATAEHVVLTQADDFSHGGGRVLFFDLRAVATTAPHLSVLVHPATPEQLCGVFALSGAATDARARWTGLQLAQRGVDARAGKPSPSSVLLTTTDLQN